MSSIAKHALVFLGMLLGIFSYELLTGKRRWAKAADECWYVFVGVSASWWYAS